MVIILLHISYTNESVRSIIEGSYIIRYVQMNQYDQLLMNQYDQLLMAITLLDITEGYYNMKYIINI